MHDGAIVKRPRPYIPVKVKLAVAVRQLYGRGLGWENRSSKTEALRLALIGLGLKKPHLDHDPPLGKRRLNRRTGKYTPDANDPRHLQWIEGAKDYDGDDGHHVKTHGRGGEKMRFGGDLREIRKQDRLEREPEKWQGLTKLKRKRRSRSKRPKQKIRSRGFAAKAAGRRSRWRK